VAAFPAASDARIDLPPQAVSEAEFEFVVPDGNSARRHTIGQGPHHVGLVFACVGYEHVELAVSFTPFLREGSGDRCDLRSNVADRWPRLRRFDRDLPDAGLRASTKSLHVDNDVPVTILRNR